jgi:aspartyl-tRNA(Asn)/glutamyl-tRNA(Gln) amidotransferase subunit A
VSLEDLQSLAPSASAPAGARTRTPAQPAGAATSAPGSPTDPADLGILEASVLLRARELSARELTEACLRRIDERNGGEPSLDGDPEAINAWARVYPQLARRAAAVADERLARDGEANPPLCGIPIALKDLYSVAGLPVTASSRVLAGHVADADAAVWARLRRAGMVLLGHTHTHEFGAGGTTDQVGNPWLRDRVAGGSSGGSAAALAARMTPAALGTDTCGSLRIPSACCGTSAIKPTHGLLPVAGLIPLAHTLDHAGPMARTIADCAALLEGMAYPAPEIRPGAPLPTPPPRMPFRRRESGQPLEGLTVAVTDRTEGLTVDPEVAVAFDAARHACERLGARVVFTPAPWALDWDDLSLVLLTEAWTYHAQHAALADRYRPAIAEFLEAARGFTDVAAYLGAQQRRAAGAAAWERWFSERRVNLVLEPTLPIVPYDRGPGYERGHPAGAADPMIALTALWDMTGMPVATLPVTWQTSVSLIAPRRAEVSLIQAAIDLQEHELGVPEWVPPAKLHAAGTDGSARRPPARMEGSERR